MCVCVCVYIHIHMFVSFSFRSFWLVKHEQTELAPHHRKTYSYDLIGCFVNKYVSLLILLPGFL